MALIRRDPFARQELHRATVRHSSRTCDWCGNLNAHRSLFHYRIETDGGRSYEDDHLFCSLPCRTAYQGEF